MQRDLRLKKIQRIGEIAMFDMGDKVLYNGKKAIVLNSDDDEVLVFLGDNLVKWVDKWMIESFQTSIVYA